MMVLYYSVICLFGSSMVVVAVGKPMLKVDHFLLLLDLRVNVSGGGSVFLEN